MSKKIRIGNDIIVNWTILDAHEEPYDLTGRNIKVFMDISIKNERNLIRQEKEIIEVQSVTIDHNVISFVYSGKMQEYTGDVALRFIENDGDNNMVTYDVHRAFEIVPHSWLEGQEDTNTIETKTADITSKVGVITGGSVSHPYLSIERLCHYLYKVSFDTLPADDGGDNNAFGACSSFVREGKLYRNLDFNFDNAASFRLRCADFEGMSFITGLNDGELDDALIAQLPYRIVDGENNYGIKVATHVLFNDWHWSGCGKRTVNLTRLPYLILSRVKSMATIAQDLDGILDNLYSPDGLQAMDYLLQVLVTDGTTTYAIVPPEADDFEYVLMDISSNPKMSNFRWIADSQVERDSSDLQERPTGVERWNMMPCDLDDLRFTKCYENDDRLSEFIGIHGTTKDSPDSDLEGVYINAREKYLTRQRDGQTWHTMHSVVYGRRMEHLYIQENWDDDCITL